MIKLVDYAGARRIDDFAIRDCGMPSVLLMENAGIKALGAMKRFAGGALSGGNVVFVAGKGNNGGDALVMARQLLAEGIGGIAVVLAFPESELGDGNAASELRLARSYGASVYEWKSQTTRCEELLNSATWIVDGLFGTGLKGSADVPAADLIGRINASSAQVCSLDVPSGIGPDYRNGFPVVEAELTLCMGLPKTFFYAPAVRALCGEIRTVDVCYPYELLVDPAIPGTLLESADLAGFLPSIATDAYKKSRGHVGVFAGSPQYAGAALLCAEAASRSLAGLVSLYCPASLCPTLAGRRPQVIVRDAASFDSSDRLSAVVAGPGWIKNEENLERLGVLIDSGLPGVLDAGALDLVMELAARRGGLDLGGRWILTPHPGELERLCGLTPVDSLVRPLEALEPLARDWNAWVLLKSHVVWAIAPQGFFFVHDGGNPAMGTGGSGDVLAGVIGGLLAAGMETGQGVREAALAGILLHQAAGRHAAREIGWFTAEDLCRSLSPVLGGAAGPELRIE